VYAHYRQTDASQAVREAIELLLTRTNDEAK
jgi:hypothetical protein